jgi:putative spermidine/putrescine transport system ATP-binding protein
MNGSYLHLHEVYKSFADGTRALQPLTLDVEKGETLVLLGPSGCGKSTLLRIISGLQTPSGGEVYLDGTDITRLVPEKRDMGFVFQHYSLFPTMTVAENITFGLMLRKKNKAEQRKKLYELLEMMNISELQGRMPHQLSGGQQQRVAVARALAIEPKVLLLDEPLTALDAQLKERLTVELAGLFQRLDITTVYVTHDQNEAMVLADRIGVMNEGVLEQVGTSQEIYTRPRTSFVASFIGQANRLEGRITNGQGGKGIDFGFWQIPYSGGKEPGQDVEAYLRPEEIRIATPEDFDFAAFVKEEIFLGERSRVVVEAAGQTLFFYLRRAGNMAPGKKVFLKAQQNNIIYV